MFSWWKRNTKLRIIISVNQKLNIKSEVFIVEIYFLFHCKEKIVLIVCHVTVTSVTWQSRDLVLVLWFGCVHYDMPINS